MNIAQKIRMAVTYKNISMAKLSDELGMTPQAMYQRLKTGKFTSEELAKIAAALGGEYEFGFVFPDGTRI